VTAVSSIDATGKRTRDGEWFTRFLPVEDEPRVESLLRFSRGGVPALSTCSAAWTRELSEAFGPLPRNVWIEDSIISFRAWLFDRIVFIPEPLVAYREHESNVCNRFYRPLTTPQARREAEHARSVEERLRRESLMSYGPDLDLAARRGWICRSTHEEIKRLVRTQCRSRQVIENWWSVGWVMRVWLFLFVVGSGQLIEGRWCGPRLLPFQAFIAMAAFWSRWGTTARKRVKVLLSTPGCTLVSIWHIIDTCANSLVAI